MINTCLLCIFTVLIDTWWNVNRYADGEYLDSLGFNRYMVECEYAIADDVYNAISGFNRYMVECEFAFISHCKRFFRVLIDTWWNVNLTFKAKYMANTTVLIDTWWNVNKILAIKAHKILTF